MKTISLLALALSLAACASDNGAESPLGAFFRGASQTHTLFGGIGAAMNPSAPIAAQAAPAPRPAMQYPQQIQPPAIQPVPALNMGVTNCSRFGNAVSCDSF